VIFFQAEDGIRDRNVTGVQTCALPICAQCLLPLGVWDGKRSRPALQSSPGYGRVLLAVRVRQIALPSPLRAGRPYAHRAATARIDPQLVYKHGIAKGVQKEGRAIPVALNRRGHQPHRAAIDELLSNPTTLRQPRETL